MADSVVSSGVGACCNWVLTPLERQLGYAAKVGEIVRDLKNEMSSLKAKSEDVTASIDADRRMDPTKETIREVEDWQRRVEEIDDKVKSITADYEQRCRCLSGCSANIYSNWNIGRKATRELVRVKALSERGGGFSSVTRAGTPPAGQKLPGTSNLVATEVNLREVLGYLAAASDAAPSVGIYGMGGVGKTTLLKEINNKLSSGGLDGMSFDHVIWVVVSRPLDIQKVQENIAKFLKLPLQDNADFKSAIFNFLDSKKFVLLLDDVWEHLDLDEVGIPDKRVVILTTRSEKVCDQMKARKKLKVECLREEDAWRLFKEEVGGDDIDRDSRIESLAMEIARECKGLPLALKVIAKTMSSKHTPEEWQDALTKLAKSQLGPDNDVQHRLFQVLKHSYDSLPDEQTRECFLVLALYPEDETILPIPLIVDYFWGQGLIDEKKFKDFGEVINGGRAIIGVLKSACLIEGDEYTLRIHDILHDMALWIACDCGRNNKKWIVRAGLNNREPLKGVNDWEMAEKLSLVSNEITELPMPKRKCDKLSYLNLEGNICLERIPEDFFQYFPALSYLGLSSTGITELPREVSTLAELQCLDLSGSKIGSLSINLRELKKLKMLGLARCKYLNDIPHGLISSLPMLQCLDIFASAYVFRNENSNNEEDREGGLYVTENSDKEEGKRNKRGKELMSDKANTEELKSLKGTGIKVLAFNLETETIADFQNLVDDDSIFQLKLTGLQDSKLDLAAFLKSQNNMYTLDLHDIAGMEELILATENHQRRRFCRLTDLVLRNINPLSKMTWNRVMLFETFSKLEALIITSCHGLRSLTWSGHLPHLRFLYILDCNGLEEIISDDENKESASPDPSSIFPKLRELVLRDLRNLHSISKGILDIPLLLLGVFRCSKLKRIPFRFDVQLEMPTIRVADSEWWEGLEWDDNSTKSYLQPFVRQADSDDEEYLCKIYAGLIY